MKPKFFLLFLIGLFFLVPVIALELAMPAQAALVLEHSLEGSASDPIQLHLIAQKQFAGEGKEIKVFLGMDLAPGWHTYWRYAGDVGLPPHFQWHLPPGWHVSEPLYSLPEAFDESGSQTFGYQKRALFAVELTPPPSWKGDTTQTIGLHFSWLACKEMCVPGNADLKITLGKKLPAVSALEKDLLNQYQQYEKEQGWPRDDFFDDSLSMKLEGGTATISFKGQPGYSYQFFPNPPQGMVAGNITVKKEHQDWVITLPWYEESDQSVATLKQEIPQKQNKKQQALRGVLVGSFIGQKGQEQKNITNNLQRGSIERHGWSLPPTSTKAIASGVASQPAPLPLSFLAFLIALGSGLVGGLILNVMPCVLPVISLKIFGFIHQAGSSKKAIFKHSIAFVAGIYTWFIGMGVLVVILKMAGKQVAWAFQFQNSIFIFGLILLLFLLGLNLFGVFELMLPGQWSSSLDRMGGRSGISGSFFQGLFATLVATPCTAPFLGSALGVAFSQGTLLLMTIFIAIATGMSLPYLLLAWQPQWVSKMPRPGPWMETFKQAMGFPLMATVLWLLIVLEQQRGLLMLYQTLVLLLLMALLSWIYGVITRKERGSLGKIMALMTILAIGGMIFYEATYLGIEGRGSIVLSSPNQSIQPYQLREENHSVSDRVKEDHIEWINYSEEQLQQLRSEGKAVFLDATAAWCLTCQFNEKRVLETAAVRNCLREQGVIAMRADWTNADPAITKLLKKFGRAGVPLYVFFPAGQGSQAILLPELLTQRKVLNVLKSKNPIRS